MPRTALAAALLCALALSGCASLPQPGNGPSLVTFFPAVIAPLPPPRPVTRADAAVQRASAELARYCGLTQAALAAVELFATDKVRAAADYAGTVVETVCSSPPSDVSTALATVGRAYAAVTAASRE